MGKLLKKKFKKKKKKPARTGQESLIEFPVPKNPDNQPIPLHNFFEYYDLDSDSDVGECFDNILFALEDGYFLRWEAIVLMERGLPLTNKQKMALDEIINFSDIAHESILYINEIPRPNEPWYEIIRKIAPKLILDPFRTYEIHNEIYHEDWLRLVECLEEHARNLSLPTGIHSPIDVVSPEIRHRLWLQYSFDVLSGLGQEEGLTLVDDEQKDWRVKEFIDTLREIKGSVKYFQLTIEKLLQFVKLQLQDEKILVKELLEKLKMKTVKEYLHDFL